MAGEGAARTQRALNIESCAMALQHVFDDGKAQAGTACCARTAGVDSIEALCKPRHVFCWDADSGVRHGEVAALLIHPPANCDRAFPRRVFGRIVDEVEEGRMNF